MKHWNHRICKSTHAVGTEFEEVFYEIKEVYYNDVGEVWATTQDGATVGGNTPDEVKSSLEKMQRALEYPILDLDTIVYAKDEDDGINWDEIENDDFMDKYDAELKKKYGDDYRTN